MPRYVILLHEVSPGAGPAATGGRGTHWDLMLECDGVLRTWALAEIPVGNGHTVAERLPDHRLAYLEYEGPVSGNRGHVTRWDAGDYQFAAESSQRLEIRLSGTRELQTVTLTRNDDGGHFWNASFSRAPMRGDSSSRSS